MATTTTRITPAYSSPHTAITIPLTILSWNISNAQPSSSSPNPHQRARESSRLIRLACLEANAGTPPSSRRPSTSSTSSHGSRTRQSPPDIIALQESPYPTWGDEEFGSSGYVSMGTQMTHCGYVDLLLRSELARTSRPLPLRVGAQSTQQSVISDIAVNLPSVATTILLPNRTRVAVSSSHLAPFKENEALRAYQCQSLMKILSDECDNCIVIGDMNMRASEDKMVEKFDNKSWIDAWKECGSDKSVKFTWDSFVNNYHDGGFRFKARFDRCYVRGGGNDGLLGVNYYGLMGNRPVGKEDGGGSRGDYLSDHFGLVVKVDVGGTATVSEEEKKEEIVDLSGDD
mmetsp:Transcript_24730/g.51791  ORF Transcript_24730/g.51791 Transcript_24730/m.51791 type:complete len:344 (+) Transcript_24730:66-1097(+)